MQHNFFSNINKIIFPPRCPVCDDILFIKNEINRPAICDNCRGRIKQIHQPACQKCGKQLEAEEQEYCFDCRNKTHFFDRGVAAFAYSEAMKQSMYAFKYNNRREYADYYATIIRRNWGEVIKSWKADVILPIPISRARFRKRGYNQAQTLASRISEQTGIALDDGFLLRVKNTVPLKELSEKARYLNLNNAFQIADNSVKYNSVILVDDIFTTGSTMDVCSQLLRAKGISRIYFITACIGYGF